LDAEPTSPSAAAPVEIDSQPALVDPRAAAEPVAVDKPAAPADEPPLIILPTDDADGVDAEPPADDSQSSVHTLFDEPLGDADGSHVPAPSLFGPDPIVAASIVADAQPMRDEPAEDYFAQDVAQWIAAHQQAWFPAPQAVRTPVRRRQQQPQRPVAPQWLDDIIHNAVRGGAIPSMLEPSAALLP
jgi:hypothetical protein